MNWTTVATYPKGSDLPLDNAELYLSLVSAAGMILVGASAILIWRQKTSLSYGWFLLGGALWCAALPIKFGIAVPANPVVYAWTREHLPSFLFLPIAGLFGGLLSSASEIGLTWIAALLWSPLGKTAERAIAVGLGAGACEAIWFGATDAQFVLAALLGYTQLDAAREKIEAVAVATPLFWLVAPVERIIVVLCHASSRALVLLGTTHRRPWMVVGGFAIFALLDGIATAAIVRGGVDTAFIWLVEAAYLPLALVSIPILGWCLSHFGFSGKGGVGEPQVMAVS